MDQSRMTPARAATGLSLVDWLSSELGATQTDRELARTITGLADACAQLAAAIRAGAASASHGSVVGSTNADGDSQRALDVIANTLILDALTATPVAFYASEEEKTVITLDAGGSLAVAVDPLDGSSNIDANMSIGTIFSIFTAIPGQPDASFLRCSREQIAAGYVVYGPHTALVLTVGTGTVLFVLRDDNGQFVLARAQLSVPHAATEFAINTSNYRHWYAPVRRYVDDCIAGTSGPREKDFNMRWVASLVADTHRILSRGGVFLYPADQRQGYQYGRLRLIYEAAPIAFLIEQAGGLATDGSAPVLDTVASSLHQRTPLIFGSAQEVERIAIDHGDPDFVRATSPLFRTRGLFST